MTNQDLASKRKSFALPPTEEEQSSWDALSREEQVRQIREFFASQEANTVSSRSVEEIFAEVRDRLRSGN